MFLSTSGAVCLSWPKPLALHSHSPKNCFTTWRIYTAQGFMFVTHTSVTTAGPSAGLISSIPRECPACLAPDGSKPSFCCQQWAAKQLFWQWKTGGKEVCRICIFLAGVTSVLYELCVLWRGAQMDSNMVFI